MFINIPLFISLSERREDMYMKASRMKKESLLQTRKVNQVVKKIPFFLTGTETEDDGADRNWASLEDIIDSASDPDDDEEYNLHQFNLFPPLPPE